MKHYHIRWSNSQLDWQPLKTEEEAKKEAERLKRPDETYVIVEQDNDCPRCTKTKPEGGRPQI